MRHPNAVFFQMTSDVIDKELDKIRETVSTLVRQQDQLRAQIALQEKPPVKGELAEILRAALKGEVGWAERARLALGDYRLIQCENCQTPFPSGGKRKKNCGNC